MPKMTDEELVSLVDGEFEEALGSSGGEIADERARAWSYYLSEKLGNEEEGQSQVVTSDVADVVDGMMPSLLRIFTMAENLVDFDPVGLEDEEAAQQESDYVNHVFFKKNPAFMILFFWFFDALAQKNGVVKAWWDDSEETTTETYEGLSEEELEELLADDELGPVERDEREIETVVEGVTEQGVEQALEKATVHDVRFKRVRKRGVARAENVPPEEYRISSDSRSLDPSQARMVGHEREVTRTDLLEMGFDKKLVETLAAEEKSEDTEEKQARRNKTDDRNEGPHDKSEDRILLREAYIRVDVDGDGRSELRQVFTAQGKLLGNEPADRQPFHVICPHPLPHKHFGRATAEKVMDVQKVSTTVLRQTMDNLYHSNNPSHAVWEQGMSENTLDDLLTTQVGSIKRFSRPVGESYQTIAVPFTAGASFPMLEYWEKVKRDRTGISSDGEGLSPESLKNIQQSVLADALDMSKMKQEAVARIFAETGIKSLFLHIHELLQKHQQKAEVAKLRGKWVQVSPKAWKTRRDMTVNVGLGIGTRERNLLHLEAIWQRQKDILQAGGMGLMLKPRDLYNNCAELVRNANFKTPERFFTDPGDAEAPSQNDGQQQLLQLQAQVTQQQLQLEVQKLQTTREREALNHQREMAKLQVQRQADVEKLSVEMEKIANAITKLELEFGRDIPNSRV